MPFLISDAERAALRIGSNTLGGRGADAVALTSLASLQPAAVITLASDGAAEVQRISASVVVKLDGEPLGAAPHGLRHGARLAIGSVRLLYAGPSAERDGAPGATDPSEEATELVSSVPIAANSGRLVELATGRSFPIPAGGLAIGRGGRCDVVVEGKGISRRHAVIKPDGPAFVVADESANGTYVNDARVEGARILGQDDIVRIGTHEFRLELDAVLPTSDAAAPSATDLLAGVPDGVVQRRELRRPPSIGAAPAGPPHQPLALLEVTRGASAQKLLRVERAACAIGRSEQNDIRFADNSVSALHATLVLKRGTWYVVDLQSANGTYVDGYRIAGERALPDGATLRIGDVAMRFRILSGAGEKSNATEPRGGIFRRLSKLWQS